MARPVRWVLVMVLVVLGVMVGTSPVGAGGGASGRAPGQGALVRRTAHGIPHVLAGDYRGLGLGSGYAIAEDNLCLLADTVVTLSAERSRWFGADASTVGGVNNLDSDLYQQRVNQRGVVERLLAQHYPVGPSRQARELVRGYAAGYNRYLAETTVAGLPDAACRGAGWVRPITELDLWRRAYQVAAVGDDGFQSMIVAAQPPDVPIAAGLSAPSATDGLSRLRRSEDVGSNAYAMGRQATTGHTGMVLGNPHTPWVGDRRFYQMQLTIPGELNVSGVAFVGMPVIGVGHTERLAWTHSNSTAVSFGLTRLTLAPGDPRGYLVDGQLRAMESETVTVNVRQPDGGLTAVTRTVYSTPDGPLVEAAGAFDWTTSSAYLLRDANATNLRAIDQWLAMAKARDVTELRVAQARLLGISTFNTIAADINGTAYYGDIQVVAHITDAQLARCAIGPVTDFVLDGSRTECGWGDDPDAVAPGLLGPARLPALFRRDHVSNMNNSPWLANPAAPLTGYPAAVGDVGTERSPRTRMGLDMIADRLDGSDRLGPPGFTLSSLQATMFGNRNLTAEEGRAATVAMCSANPTLTAPDGPPVDVRAACAGLAGWDGRGDLDARGAVLWRKFVERLRAARVNFWLVPFDSADPARTPRGFDADRPGVRQAFADTVRAFDAVGVPVDLRLGDFQHYAGVPIHGCSSAPEGCFNQISLDTTLRQDAATPDVTHGSTFIMAVELTQAGPRTRTILTYGQSVNPASPHFTDQTRLYAAKQWVVDRFTEAEIARDPALTATRLTGYQ